MDAIRAKHSGLIDGLNKLFDLLVKTRRKYESLRLVRRWSPSCFKRHRQ